MDAPLDAEDLSRHGQFVFSLARALLRDAHAAEDVAQETWLHWLRAGRGVADARGWLGRAARHLAANRRRSEDRRARHEELAAAPEPSEDPQQKAAEAELLHRLVDAVYALDEPYCGTILARHFEGLSPRALAARLDVPLATVRSREQRALALLRARLDRTHGGRRAWAATLTRLVSGGEVGAGIGIAVLVAAGLVAAGLVFTYEWPWVSPSKARSTAGVAARIVAASEAGITTAGITTAQAPTRREVHAADEIVAAELEQDEALDGVLAGRTLDALGEPVEGVWVIVETAAGERRAFSDAQGAFRLADVGDVRGITAERPGWLFLHATDPEGEPTSLRLEPVTVTLTRSAPLVLDLRTTTGAPIPEVEVDLVPRGEELQDCIAGRDLRRAPRIEGTTDASGHVEFPNVWTGLHLAIGLHLEPNGLTGARQDAGRLCFDPAQPGGPVVVPAGGLALEARLQHFRVAGSVRKRDGRPARPAYGRLLDLGVALGDEARALAERFLSSSGGDTFEFEGFASFVRGPLEVRVMVKGDTVQEVEIKGATLHTSVQEWATLYLEAGDGWERDGLELTLTRTESGSLTGHVLDPEGNELSAGIRILSPESPTEDTFSERPTSCLINRAFHLSGLGSCSTCDLAVCTTLGARQHTEVFRGLPVGAHHLQLRVTPESAVHVRLRLVGGNPAALSALTITRFPSAGECTPPAPAHQRVTDLTRWPSDVSWTSQTGADTADPRQFATLVPIPSAGDWVALEPGAPGVYAFGILPREGSRRPYFPMATERLFFEAGTYTIEFALVPTASIAGRVRLDGTRELFEIGLVDATGRPLPLDADARGRPPLSFQPLPASGRFFLRDVPSGRFRLRAGTHEELAAGGYRVEKEIEILAGVNAPVEL